MDGKPKESDWKQFRKMVPDLRERYVKTKNHEILGILTSPEKSPTEQFWDTLDVMEKESKVLVDCLDGHSRSNMFMHMSLMCRYGMLTQEDLKCFSEELQESMARYLSEST